MFGFILDKIIFSSNLKKRKEESSTLLLEFLLAYFPVKDYVILVAPRAAIVVYLSSLENIHCAGTLWNFFRAV